MPSVNVHKDNMSIGHTYYNHKYVYFMGQQNKMFQKKIVEIVEGYNIYSALTDCSTNNKSRPFPPPKSYFYFRTIYSSYTNPGKS